MKTPMQELIEFIESTNNTPYVNLTIMDKAKKLLEREKEEISIAYNNGIKNPYTNIWVQLSQRETTRGEIYYEERYKQNNL
jgi:hypothetical protein